MSTIPFAAELMVGIYDGIQADEGSKNKGSRLDPKR